jgi:signal transduction histidine kinase
LTHGLRPAGGSLKSIRLNDRQRTIKNQTRRIEMKKVLVGMALVICVVLGTVLMAQASALDDAKGLAEKAAAYLKANGKDKAIAEINNPKGQFVKGDLYVYLQDYNGVILAHGGNVKLVGQNHLEVKDPSGKFFVKDQIALLKSKGSGWIEYVWTNPATKKVQPKKSWIQKIDGADMWVGCGVFQ